MSTGYFPVEKADPESALASPSAASTPRPTQGVPRKPWLVGLALGSIVALHLGAKFGPSLVDGAFERSGCHGKHARNDGYLQGAPGCGPVAFWNDV
jgi:hypothetical protein